MKVYYPTTSLNFNDIMATESISPKSFYKHRSFGTKRNFSTSLSLHEDIITLYTLPPQFKLDLSSYEQYPIVVEIDLDLNEYHTKNINNIQLYVQQTIYLNPNTTRFHFFSKKALDIVISKSKSNNETKLVEYYSSRFNLLDVKSLHTVDIVHSINLTQATTFLKEDNIYNSIKGLLYAMLSEYFRKFSNKNTYILSNVYNLIDEALKLNSTISGNEDLEIVKDSLSLARKYAVKNLRKQSNKTELIKDFINQVTYNDNKLDGFDFATFCKLKNFTSYEYKLYLLIINILLTNSKQNTTPSVDKKYLLTIVNMIESQMKKRNFPKNYMISCREIYKKLNERLYEIDLNEIDSNVFKNLLAFLLKTNNIFELEKFLTSKKIDNSIIAYSFLGAYLGFSGLSRLLTNEIYNTEKEYIYCIESTLYNIRTNLYRLEHNQAKIINNSLNVKPAELYNEINRIRKSKMVNKMLRLKTYKSKEHIINIQKENNNILILIETNNSDYLYNLLLINKSNVDQNITKKFNEQNESIGTKSRKGNFPIYEINITDNNKNRALTLQEYNDLVVILQTIK